MPGWREWIPSAALVESACLPELAGHVLRVLKVDGPSNRRLSQIQPAATWLAQEYSAPGFGPHVGVRRACIEALEWLAHHGFLSQYDDQGPGWVRLSRKGERCATEQGFDQWIADQELPEVMFHQSLRQTLGLFQQGRFDLAVFEAFKKLEVAICDAACLGDEFVGMKLTARAFHPEKGPLTDTQAEQVERQALMSVMGGAMGSYKNPQSHRHVGVTAAEAREMIMMASHLLKIVDGRKRSLANCG